MNYEFIIKIGLDSVSRLTYMQSGQTFTIQQLFDANVWGLVPNQYKASFNIIFYDYVKNNKFKDIKVYNTSGNKYTYIKN